MFWLFGLAHWLVLITTAERSGAVYSTDITRLHIDNIYVLRVTSAYTASKANMVTGLVRSVVDNIYELKLKL